MFQVNFIKQNNFNTGKEITQSFSYKSKYATVMDNIAIYLKMSFCQNIQISMSVFTRRKKCKNVNHIYFFILIHNYIHLKILFVQRTVLLIIFKISMNNFSPDCEFWNGHSIIFYTSVILESVFSVHKTLDYLLQMSQQKDICAHRIMELSVKCAQSIHSVNSCF